MNLRQCLSWWRHAPTRPRSRTAAPDWVNAGCEPGPEQLDEVLLGCGWFDSSHELHAGLQVTHTTCATPNRFSAENCAEIG